MFWIGIQVHHMLAARFQSSLNFLIFKRKAKIVSPSQICYKGYARNIWRQVAMYSVCRKYYVGIRGNICEQAHKQRIISMICISQFKGLKSE